jgi:hypothetical protein
VRSWGLTRRSLWSDALGGDASAEGEELAGCFIGGVLSDGYVTCESLISDSNPRMNFFLY